MSNRIDIENKIFNDIKVLKFIEKQNTHAFYKCLCMLCNEITNATYSNLISGNTKSCAKCGQKISNGLEQDISLEMKHDKNISRIAKKYNVNRGVIYRIKKDEN